jgi:hypothetical protein
MGNQKTQLKPRKKWIGRAQQNLQMLTQFIMQHETCNKSQQLMSPTVCQEKSLLLAFFGGG